ncbi:MAG: helix-turn-helix domain-containing protein [Thermomicrobiales bacterium]
MPTKLDLRSATPEEERVVLTLAASRTQPVRLVQRAKLLVMLLDDPAVSASVAGRRAGLSGPSGCAWVKRFNDGGLGDLRDAARGDRPPTHAPDVRSRLVSLATQKPSRLELPFDLWTLERLQRAFEEREGVHLSDSTIWTWLRDEGLQWKRQQSWFHDAERHDPEFVETRGPSSEPTPHHQPDVA